MSLAVFTNRIIKEIKKTHTSTYAILLLIIVINMYDYYSSALGKLINLMLVIYLMLNENVILGLISFFIVLLLNNKNYKEGFNDVVGTKDTERPNKDKEGDKSSSINETLNEESTFAKDSKDVNKNDLSENPETNDSIASFKKLHCKNGKFMKDGSEINIADLTSNFPQLKFNLENEKCNPCEDNCQFKITSGNERLSIEEQLKPKPSSAISTS